MTSSSLPAPLANGPASGTTSNTWIEDTHTSSSLDPVAARELWGGKGAGLKEMTALGIPVPPGIVLSTALCNWFYAHKKKLPDTFDNLLHNHLTKLEERMDLALGDPEKPLLLSVRSGGRASMPGMMDTILNLGLNDNTVKGLAKRTGAKRFAFDSYRRFIQMYSNVVLGLGLEPFETILEQYRKVRGVTEDSALNEDDLVAIVGRFKEHVHQMTGMPFIQDTQKQLRQAIEAVFKSWMNKRAVAYRRLYNIPETWGTAVTVQAMVFGNLGHESGTGVAFSRDPSTGAPSFFGEYLLNAQGEDVVAGIRTPKPLTKAQGEDSLEKVMPDVFQNLNRVRRHLEQHYKDMQDIEFTIQQKKLWILQTRAGKRTASASLRIHMDMVDEGLITKEDALKRFDPLTVDQLLHPRLPENHGLRKLGSGLPASPGAAVGHIALTPEMCLKFVEQGKKSILVREETSPEDIEGMAKAKGILTACGGMTSHAAVVARGMGKPCIVGTTGLHINLTQKALTLGGTRLEEGDTLTLDGHKGDILLGQGTLVLPPSSEHLAKFMTWADEKRRLSIRANADTPEDVQKAFEMGAEGIGLCRTEHMFFESQRILAIRKMILASTSSERESALAELEPMQTQDFTAMLLALKGKALTVRLLDPPLHEFLPQGEAEIDQLAHALEVTTKKIRARLLELKEANPMLGNRGCRLGLTMPGVYDMQVRALLKASYAASAQVETNIEIMVPLVSLAGEFRALKKRIQKEADATERTLSAQLPYSLGTMIELPRAALKADKIAQEADFLSFGTNDLTQTTFGFSRDDVNSFLPTYRHKGLLVRDPFASLDQSGVGELIRIAVKKARSVSPTIKMGICGEHGGDPQSIEFFDRLGLDYVSCSPYRVPVARLAAAAAHIRNRS